MFQWSKKVVKSVSFNPGVADESLLALVESHLEKYPHKTFSDLCKEALWQSLCVPDSVRPSQKPTTSVSQETDPNIAELQSQLADLEERFFARESDRLVDMERQIMQLTQQVAQLAIMVSERPVVIQTTIPSAITEVANHTVTPPPPPPAPPPPPPETDPLLSRLSQFLDDF